MDVISKEKRSWNMSRIRNKNTKPEMIVRSLLHRMGYRFRLHKKCLPGKPDIVLKQYRTAIFVNGCFWHRHENCKFAYTPKSRKDFWMKKFRENIERDKLVMKQLENSGWEILIIWECETKDISVLQKRLKEKLHYE
ncbi:MAG: DNA mismatch endonuclease Vsr [Candidatus Cloacimonetes bacterium]|jgi:DNA mismatch endonuclease (patch repair protein)|nr:DNA mismatch endonuclease Vsr [Candidatus Cloacimonadota bacterium]